MWNPPPPTPPPNHCVTLSILFEAFLREMFYTKTFLMSEILFLFNDAVKGHSQHWWWKFFRKKLRTLQGKEKKRPSRRSNNNKTKNTKRKTFFQDRESSRQTGGVGKVPSLTQLDRIAIENSLLLSGTGGGQLYHEQYDEHGVKIEYQCFK